MSVTALCSSLPRQLRAVLTAALVGAVLLIYPFADQTLGLGTLYAVSDAMIYVLLALGLNIVVGYAGLLDLGYAAFFAIGAYTMGIFNSPLMGFEWGFWNVIWLSAVVSAAFHWPEVLAGNFWEAVCLTWPRWEKPKTAGR